MTLWTSKKTPHLVEKLLKYDGVTRSGTDTGRVRNAYEYVYGYMLLMNRDDSALECGAFSCKV